MSFKELVRQSMKTEEQLQQERENEKQRIFREENEAIINNYLGRIKDDILSMAASGKIHNGKVSNTVHVPSQGSIEEFCGVGGVFGGINSRNFFGEKRDHTKQFKDYVLYWCHIYQETLTYSNISRLKLVFDEVKKRALVDGIEVSDPFILIEIWDRQTNRPTVKETRKVMMQNNSLSATFSYKKHHTNWHNRSEDYGTLSLAVDYHCTV